MHLPAHGRIWNGKGRPGSKMLRPLSLVQRSAHRATVGPEVLMQEVRAQWEQEAEVVDGGEGHGSRTKDCRNSKWNSSISLTPRKSVLSSCPSFQVCAGVVCGAYTCDPGRLKDHPHASAHAHTHTHCGRFSQKEKERKRNAAPLLWTIQCRCARVCACIVERRAGQGRGLTRTVPRAARRMRKQHCGCLALCRVILRVGLGRLAYTIRLHR